VDRKGRTRLRARIAGEGISDRQNFAAAIDLQ